MAVSLSACGGGGGGSSYDGPTIDQLTVGKDYTDLAAEIQVFTNRTDLVNKDFQSYVTEFNKLYPNITVTYEGSTNYDSDATTRMTAGDWGDICMIPSSLQKSDFEAYFQPLGSKTTLEQTYDFLTEKSFQDQVYGIPSMGNAQGIIYNKKIFEQAGITEIPKTPDEFLDALQKIKDNTDATPLYTNFAAGWTLAAWDAYISGSATGDPDYANQVMVHEENPFSDRGDMTGPYAVYYVMYEAVKRGLVEDDPVTSDWESSKNRINTGEIGCMVLGSWAVSQCQEAGPNPKDIGYMSFPITVNGKQYATAGADYCYAVNINSSDDEKIASMLYIKWLTESSDYSIKQGGLPTVKGGPIPDVLAAFEENEVTFVVNNDGLEGEEDLQTQISNGSELTLNSDYSKHQRLIESALDGSKTLDDNMDEWNAAWTNAQNTYGSIQSESGLGLGAGFSQGKAEDAGGLTPVKDDNAAMRKSSPRTSSIFGRMEHYGALS